MTNARTLTIGSTGKTFNGGANVSWTLAEIGAESANANIQSHISSTSNPHGTTAGQVGAEPANANIQSHISSTSNPHNVTKTQVGLSNVTNESKATMFTSPAFTGTVSGVTKTHVGLGNVDNTSDANKPVSTATQTALNLKANIASPTFTGTVTAPSFLATSDRRLKENITDYNYHNSILDLTVKEFDYKETNIHTIGFIAQELQEKFPELVVADKDGYLAIAESKLVYLLLEEVKLLKEEIRKLKE